MVSGATSNPFRWGGDLGYYSDGECDEYYILARNYNPNTGRWLSRDPLGMLISNDDNLYAYAANSPSNATDPTGLAWQIAANGLRYGYRAIARS